MAFKMKGFKPGKGTGMNSAFEKALVGNQKNLPEHLKAKIEAAPESPMTYGDSNPNLGNKGSVDPMSDDEKRYRQYLKDGKINQDVFDQLVSQIPSGEEVASKVESPMTKVSYSDAKKNDPNLDKNIKSARKYKNSDPELYDMYQDKVNEAYGSNKRHTKNEPMAKLEQKKLNTKKEPGITKLPTRKSSTPPKKEAKKPRYKKRIENIQKRGAKKEAREENRAKNKQTKQNYRDSKKKLKQDTKDAKKTLKVLKKNPNMLKNV